MAEKSKLSSSMLGILSVLIDMVGKDRAPKTLSKYETGWRRWTFFANREGFCRLPASPLHIALFYTEVYLYCVRNRFTDSPVEDASLAIAYAHTRTNLPSPAHSALAQTVLDYAKRSLGRPSKKSKPFTTELLIRLHAFYKNEQDVGWFMIFTSMVVAFCGFFRFDDMANLDLSLSRFYTTHMVLFIVSSKTDQHCVGAWVPIAWNGTVCPVEMLKALIRRGNISSGTFLRRVTRTKNGTFLNTIPLGYSRYLTLFRSALVRAGIDSQDAAEFGTRCFRTGGASAADKHDVPARLRMAHGRWRSEPVSDGYVQRALRERLLVSRNLGL
eukprot:Lithocolla_globosa_v1_NODE_546_length_3772_cov_29.305623.p2 type:complete len:328 gc:universal NODE_546_length_3772_cov_29.305623:1174-191(-)